MIHPVVGTPPKSLYEDVGASDVPVIEKLDTVTVESGIMVTRVIHCRSHDGYDLPPFRRDRRTRT